MNNNERILHILDQSTCLTRRQMKDYLAGTMLPEEIHAAEMHISSCPLCSMALDGFEAHSDEALEAIASLNSGFLKEHFDAITPKIHLNSLAPAATFEGKRKKKAGITLLQVTSIAAALVVGFGILWFIDHRKAAPAQGTIAAIAPAQQATPAAAPAKTDREPVPARAPEPAASVAAKVPATPVPVQAPGDAMQAAAPTPARQQAPLVTAAATPPASGKATAAETIEKKPTTSVSDQASLTSGTYASKNGSAVTVGGGRAANGTVYVTDGMQIKQEDSKKIAVSARKASVPPLSESKWAKETDEADRDGMDNGDALYEQKKYSRALAQYKREMNTGDRSRRAQAALKAARCYNAMGDKKQAIALLQDIVSNESGPSKRQARRLLRELQR